jgi:hypothetical protein
LCRYPGRLRKHGFYSRYAITENLIYCLFIQRYICPCCGRTVSLLPSFLARRFQYTLEFIFKALSLVVLEQMAVTRAIVLLNLAFCRQHIHFYRRRLQEGSRVYLLFLASWGYDVQESEHCLVACINSMGPERFALEFKRTWHQHFLGRF